MKRCTYRTFMRNDKKWRTLQILIVLFAVVSVLVHLAWFHLKWPKVPITVDSSQWTHSHVRTDMFDVTKWVKETWKLLGITLRSPGLSRQCSQSQPTTRQPPPLTVDYVLVAQAGGDEFNSQQLATLRWSKSAISTCNYCSTTHYRNTFLVQSRNCSILLYPVYYTAVKWATILPHASSVNLHIDTCKG